MNAVKCDNCGIYADLRERPLYEGHRPVPEGWVALYVTRRNSGAGADVPLSGGTFCREACAAAWLVSATGSGPQAATPKHDPKEQA